MSIINRSNITKNHTTNQEYTTIFFKPSKSLFGEQIENMIDSSTLDNLNVTRAYVFKHPDYKSVVNSQINVIEVENLDNPVVKLEIIKQFVDKKENVIVVDNGYAFIKNCVLPTDGYMYCNYSKENLLQKFGLDTTILANIIIIPYSDINSDLVYYAINLCKKIVANPNMLQIVFSLIDKKFKNRIKPISDSKIFNMIKNIKYVKELYQIPNFIRNIDFNIKSYNTNSYTYYPFFDLNQPAVNSITDTFNTNGFYYANNGNVYKNMYTRFNKYSSGLILTNNRISSTAIPKIIHYVYTDDINHTVNFEYVMKKILQPIWKYELWTIDRINDFIKQSRWYNFYKGAKKNIVAKLAILERYGGTVIQTDTILLKMFDDNILNNTFFISFEDESAGTDLSYAVMGAVPAFIEDAKTDLKKIDPARKPFVGKNNYFINLKEDVINKKNINFENIDQIKHLFQNFYNLFENENTERKIYDAIKNLIFDSIDVNVYPSYYFNDNGIFRKYFKENCFCNKIHPINKNKNPKPSLIRVYQTTPQSMAASLTDNPVNKFTHLLKNI